MCEKLPSTGDVLHEAAEHGIARGAAAADVDALLQRALDEGYLLALRFNRGCTDARLGLAEVRLTQARRAAACGDVAHATEWATASADAYAAALANPGALGTLAERCEVQYNFACAASNCGACAVLVSNALGDVPVQRGLMTPCGLRRAPGRCESSHPAAAPVRRYHPGGGPG